MISVNTRGEKKVCVLIQVLVEEKKKKGIHGHVHILTDCVFFSPFLMTFLIRYCIFFSSTNCEKQIRKE
jgi:hypothetical protein